MTSFLTTGGIRGGKVQLEKFVPRTFNMGFSRRVYERVGGFREMFSEDIDMSTRIRRDDFSIGLLRDVPVWHKRRGNLGKFFRQVYVFGMSRITEIAAGGALHAVVACDGASFVVFGEIFHIESAAEGLICLLAAWDGRAVFHEHYLEIPYGLLFKAVKQVGHLVGAVVNGDYY